MYKAIKAIINTGSTSVKISGVNVTLPGSIYFRHLEPNKQHVKADAAEEVLRGLDKSLTSYKDHLGDIAKTLKKGIKVSGPKAALYDVMLPLAKSSQKRVDHTNQKRKLVYMSMLTNFHKIIRVLKKRNEILESKAKKLISKAKKTHSTVTAVKAAAAVSAYKKSVR